MNDGKQTESGGALGWSAWLDHKSTHVLQRQMGDGAWIDWRLNLENEDARLRLHELQTERPQCKFRIVVREIKDRLYVV